jgi:hypothetical protein
MKATEVMKSSKLKGGYMTKNPKKTDSKTTAVTPKVGCEGRKGRNSKSAAGSALSQALVKSSRSRLVARSSALAETDKDILRANRNLIKAVTAIRNSRSQ